MSETATNFQNLFNKAGDEHAAKAVKEELDGCAKCYLTKLITEGDRVVDRINKANGKIVLSPIFCLCAFVTFLFIFAFAVVIATHNYQILHNAFITKACWTFGIITFVINVTIVYIYYRWMSKL